MTEPESSEMPASLARFVDEKTILLETKKRDGAWVPTPVNLVIDGGRAYFRTYDAAGKVKRLRNFSEVRVAPCTMRGKPTGPVSAGRAHPIDGADAERASDLLDRRFPIMHKRIVHWMHRRKGWESVHYELIVSEG